MDSIAEELVGADLGDARLNRRLVKIGQALAGTPPLSIPAATDARADWEAAYRFFSNQKVTPAKLLQPHREATLERIRHANAVVLVQDTTAINLTRRGKQVEGAGLLGTSESQFGSYFHPLIAIDEQALALGIVWQRQWTRDSVRKRESKQAKAKRRAHTPIEQKESSRWLAGVRESAEVARLCRETQCIAVADSESDIYEVIQECALN